MRLYALKIFVALAALGLLPGIAARAQGRVYEPAAGSVERKAIMDALRKPVEIKLNRPILFRVPPSSGFRAQNGWAFLTAELRKPDGSPMDFRGTPSADRDHESDEVDSLLHRTQGRWRVVALALCPSDVEWGDWRRKCHAPAAIFPPTR